MNDILDFLSKLKDPVLGMIIMGLFYMLWMKEKTCQRFAASFQALSETVTKAVTILEMLSHGHIKGN